MSEVATFHVPKRHLFAVLNEAVLHGKEQISIRSPLLDIRLLDINLGTWKVSKIAKERDFALDLPHLDDELRKDLPGPTDLRQCLVTSGILAYGNQREIDSILADASERASNVRREQKKVFVGMDTNMMYLHFPSRRIPKDAGFCQVVSKGVDKELTNAIGPKYKQRQLQAMKRGLPRIAPVDELFNVPMKKQRGAKSARAEVKHITHVTGGLKAECRGLTTDPEANDTLLVESYGRFARENNFSVLLVTNDRDFVDKAEAEEMNCLNVLYPKEVPLNVASGPVPVMHCITDLANLFGMVDIKGLGARVFGAWKGKSQKEYLDEVIRLDVQKSSTIHDDLERDLQILDVLNSI